MTPKTAAALWDAGLSVTRIAQELSRAANRDVSVGEVCRELWQARKTAGSRPVPGIRPTGWIPRGCRRMDRR